uniref:Uncharacterized protein n=1 Tax=Nelumbo nucifera TaxID=4432 RepID=A0A822ZLP3_NELNU|nr:TPA_asm: hypothetical protein HUJ06_004047 [Nelumbo nucifera]DAD45827.1 TPA_asm: hypothetical protein HUJ06_004057 [Nelumbo nucifera]
MRAGRNKGSVHLQENTNQLATSSYLLCKCVRMASQVDLVKELDFLEKYLAGKRKTSPPAASAAPTYSAPPVQPRKEVMDCRQLAKELGGVLILEFSRRNSAHKGF